MIAHGQTSKKNQMSDGAYHHKNNACAVRFANSRMTASYHNSGHAK